MEMLGVYRFKGVPTIFFSINVSRYYEFGFELYILMIIGDSFYPNFII